MFTMKYFTNLKMISFSLLSLFCATVSAQEVTMSVTDVSLKAGQTASATISMDFDENAIDVLGCQLFISGESLDGENIALKSISAVADAYETGADLGLSNYNTKKNRYTITVSDKEAEPMYSGEFLKLNFQVGEDVPVGTYAMTLTPEEISIRGQATISLPDITFTLTVEEPATTFGATDVEIIPGRSEVSVVGYNTERKNDIVGVSFNIYVPDGLTIGAAEAINEAFSEAPAVTLGDYDSANKCYPATVTATNPFLQSAEWNDFLNLSIVASEDVPSGDHVIRIADIEVATIDGKVVPSEETSFTVIIPARINSSITVPDVNLMPGRSVECIVSMESDLPHGFQLMQFNLSFDTELTLVNAEAIESAFEGIPAFACSFNSDEALYNVSIACEGDEAVCANEGVNDFMKLTFSAARNLTVGNTYTVTLSAFEGSFLNTENVLKEIYPAPADAQFVITLIEPTGIEEVSTMKDNGDCYNLMGINVKNNLQKGVYVRNGKKFIVE